MGVPDGDLTPDEEEDDGQRQYLATILVTADPDKIRGALGAMIDLVLEQADIRGTILDWGSTTVTSLRAYDPETGEEFIKFGMALRGLGFDDDVPES